jgi:hypothetical protein
VIEKGGVGRGIFVDKGGLGREKVEWCERKRGEKRV